jgi:hypothetical protein
MSNKTNYYQVIGKNKHVPVTYYGPAPNMATIKCHFYLHVGTDINTVLKISKKQYEKNLQG